MFAGIAARYDIDIIPQTKQLDLKQKKNKNKQ